MVMPDLGPADVRYLMGLAREFGVRSLHFKGLTLEMQRPPAADPVPDAAAFVMPMPPIDPGLFADKTQSAFSEDEVLFWSAGGAGAVNTKGEAVVPPLVGEEP